MKEYPLKNQKGTLFIEKTVHTGHLKNALLGIQVAKDGRIWVCLGGEAWIRFTPQKEETIEERWGRALRKTWDYIGDDILHALDAEARSGHSTMPRSHVFEVCCDYVDVHGGLSKEDLEAFRQRNIKKDRYLIPKVFPYKRYGF